MNHEHQPDDIELDGPTPGNFFSEDFFLSVQTAPINNRPPYNLAYSPTSPSLLGFGDPNTLFSNSYPASPIPSSPASSVGDLEKPLGLLTNDLITNDFIWECKRGATDPWTLEPTDGSLFPCRRSFQDQLLFLEHYKTVHEPFTNERIVSRCKCCGSFETFQALNCTKCRNDACYSCGAFGPLDTWYYGTMMPPTPSLTSATSTIPIGQGFGNGLLSPSPSFFGSNSYVSNSPGPNPFGIYGSSYAGSTSSQTFGAAAASQPAHDSFHQPISNHNFHLHPNQTSIFPIRMKKDHHEPP